MSVHIDENVIWPEISMDDSMSMELVEGNEDLRHEITDGIEGHGTFGEAAVGNGDSKVGDVHVGDDVKGGWVVESRSER